MVHPIKRARRSEEDTGASASSIVQSNGQTEIQAKKQRMDINAFTQILALMQRRGLFEEGKTGWAELWKWEKGLSIDFSLISEWPSHSALHRDLLGLLETPRRYIVKGSRLYSLLSAYHRWVLGIPLRVYGSLEDLRWLISVCDDPWANDHISDIIAGCDTFGRLDDKPTAAHFNIMQYPQWGASPPQSPAATGSGCIWVTCVLAVLELRLQHPHPPGEVGEFKAGETRDAKEAAMVPLSAWERMIAKVIHHSGPLNELCQCKPNDLDDDERRWRVDAVHEVVKKLITFVWAQLTRALIPKVLFNDARLTLVWELFADNDAALAPWLDEAWKRLAAVAGPDAAVHEERSEAAYHRTWSGTPMDSGEFVPQTCAEPNPRLAGNGSTSPPPLTDWLDYLHQRYAASEDDGSGNRTPAPTPTTGTGLRTHIAMDEDSGLSAFLEWRDYLVERAESEAFARDGEVAPRQARETTSDADMAWQDYLAARGCHDED